MTAPTQRQRETRNRIVTQIRRALSTCHDAELLLRRRVRGIQETALLAAQVAGKLEAAAKELRMCVADLGYGGTDE
jgi:hypothetical protein